jgi:hypothetical protein
VYRTYSWLAPLVITRLHGWQLAGAEDRLARSQARLLLAGSQFSLSAPFTILDEARAEASAAPQRLLLAGGGAIAALALFIVLAGGGLRRDQRAELVRLRNAGARTHHCVLFVTAESGWLCAGALSVGAAAGGTGWRDPDAQPDHPRGGDSAGRRVARGDCAARHAGTGAQREADRPAGGRGGGGPGGDDGRGHG